VNKRIHCERRWGFALAGNFELEFLPASKELYHCGQYLAEAVESVLARTYGPKAPFEQ
jgi:hypothetical protein